MTEICPRKLRDVCGQFGTGVTVITTRCGGLAHGMTANAFMSISLDPPLVGVSIAEKARMLPRIQETGRFGVSILAEDMGDLAWHFAGRPCETLGNCFEDQEDVPVIKSAVAQIVADVADEVLAGDHTIFIGRVRQMSFDATRRPLMFFRGQFGQLAEARPASAPRGDFCHELVW